MSRHTPRWLPVLLGLVAFSPANADSPDAEYQIKIALIYKLTKFVTWPEGTFTADDQPFSLCVLGRDPFGHALDALSTRQVRGHPISAARHARIQTGAANCDLVFVADSQRQTLDAALEGMRQRPILTVSDIPGFAEQGGMVEITRDDKRLRFRINLAAAAGAGLRIAAPLLDLSDVVQ